MTFIEGVDIAIRISAVVALVQVNIVLFIAWFTDAYMTKRIGPR